jgi:hypothetical protein
MDLRIVFANGEIIHLRPSGNAPEFRCYAEASSDARAREITVPRARQNPRLKFNASGREPKRDRVRDAPSHRRPRWRRDADGRPSDRQPTPNDHAIPRHPEPRTTRPAGRAPR